MNETPKSPPALPAGGGSFIPSSSRTRERVRGDLEFCHCDNGSIDCFVTRFAHSSQ